MSAAKKEAFFPESEAGPSFPVGVPGVDESGLRRLPEAPEPELALADLPDLSELLEPVAPARPRSLPPPVPPPRKRVRAQPPAAEVEPFEFAEVLSWYRPRIAAEGEEIARVSIPPGLILPPEADEDDADPWEPTVGQVALSAVVTFALVWSVATFLG